MKATCKTCGLRWEVSERRAKAKGGYVCPYCASRARRRYIFAAIGLTFFLLLFGTVGGMDRGRTSFLTGMLLCMVWLAGAAGFLHLAGAFVGQREEGGKSAHISGLRRKPSRHY